MVRAMTVMRLDHVSIVVEDLDAAIAFFETLGLEVEGKMPIEGRWVDRINNIEGLKVDIVMMHTPDGHGKLELTRFRHPPLVDAQPRNPPPNTLGLRSIMFLVDDVDAAVESLRPHGGTLIGEVVAYENVYRLCYLRGPGESIVALAEELG
jgi:catechol 2,3-dioxygenase-like lactoylglutathione lyase family enzyme